MGCLKAGAVLEWVLPWKRPYLALPHLNQCLTARKGRKPQRRMCVEEDEEEEEEEEKRREKLSATQKREGALVADCNLIA